MPSTAVRDPESSTPVAISPVLMRVEKVSKRFSRQISAPFRHTFGDILRRLAGVRWKARPLRGDEFWALREIDFEIQQGECVAVIGDNGAGKSTLVKLLMGRMLPTEGRIQTHGTISALTVLGLGFDPVLSGRENIFLNAATLGLARRQTEAILDKIIDFAEIREFIDAPVQSYSSGMRARLGYAVAAHVDPDILLLDEVLAVGDIRFRRKCRTHIKGYIESGGTVLLVTHDLQAVQTICTRCIVLDRGQILFDGAPTEGIHLYTQSRMDEESAASTIVFKHHDAAEGVGDGKPPSGASQAPDEGMALPASDESPPSPPEEIPVPAVPPANGSISEQISSSPDEVELPSQREAIVERIPSATAVLNSVRLESASIRPIGSQQIRTGAPMEIRLRFHSTEEIPSVAWGFTFCTPDGLTHIGTVIGGLGNETYSIAKGSGEFWCKIPRLPLTAGKYLLKAGIGDVRSGAAIAEVGWEDLPVTFVVQSDPTAENNMHSVLGDLVVIDAELGPPIGG